MALLTSKRKAGGGCEMAHTADSSNNSPVNGWLGILFLFQYYFIWSWSWIHHIALLQSKKSISKKVSWKAPERESWSKEKVEIGRLSKCKPLSPWSSSIGRASHTLTLLRENFLRKFDKPYSLRLQQEIALQVQNLAHDRRNRFCLLDWPNVPAGHHNLPNHHHCINQPHCHLWHSRVVVDSCKVGKWRSGNSAHQPKADNYPEKFSWILLVFRSSLELLLIKINTFQLVLDGTNSFELNPAFDFDAKLERDL